ncbi:class I SAM-dependent methyltransferase [bacterium BMS3Abin03]|jgi:SAM-dependent methyltransferase|nr:class I SAM-dependent methyltransferase [bacterium BMS3Abin03]
MNSLLKKVIKDYIPSDHSKQVSIDYYLKSVLKIQESSQYQKVLDLGCGQGNSLKDFTELNDKIDWYGIDIEKSPEVLSRAETNERFITFDGINIPFEKGYFDLIYCRQVFEHVKNPRELLKEVNRVLKPGGYFIGSTSHLEPFHSYSYWNYTPFGFSVLLEEAKLKLIELRPGIDSITLILRRGIKSRKLFKIFWRIESPLNFLISVTGKLFRISQSTLNAVKLNLCGQFIFFVTKNE